MLNYDSLDALWFAQNSRSYNLMPQPFSLTLTDLNEPWLELFDDDEYPNQTSFSIPQVGSLQASFQTSYLLEKAPGFK